MIDRVAMAAPAADQSAAALGAFFGKRPSGCHRQNLMIAAASQRTRRLRFANMVNIVAEEAAMLDNLTGGRLDLGLGRGLRPPEFEAFAVDQAQSREMFVESFTLIRRIWADENFVHHGKYWTVVKNGPLSPPLVQRPHPPFLVSAPRPRKSGSHQTPCWREQDSNTSVPRMATVSETRLLPLWG